MNDEMKLEDEDKKFNNENPNWEYVGRLKNVSLFEKDKKMFSWITTSTTFFAIQGVIHTPVHAGQAVKLSKKDNAAKIGSLLVYRPGEDELICTA